MSGNPVDKLIQRILFLSLILLAWLFILFSIIRLFNPEP